jgi:predicted DNA-binding transcriptional regulator AlpA
MHSAGTVIHERAAMNPSAHHAFPSPATPSGARHQSAPLLLSAPESAAKLGMSVRRFHQLRPSLPQPVVLGPRHVRWRLADLVAWVEGLSANSEVRSEPPQLQAGRAARKASAAPLVVDGLAGFKFPASESQQPRGTQQSPVPSNRSSGLAAA